MVVSCVGEDIECSVKAASGLGRLMKLLSVGRRPVPWVSTYLLVLIGSIVFVNMRDVAGVLVALNSQKQLAVEWTILHLLHKDKRMFTKSLIVVLKW